MDMRKWGVAAVALGVLALVAVAVLAPPPENLGTVVREARESSSDGGRVVLAMREAQLGREDPESGSRVAVRYDAEADATYALFGCGHEYCDTAVRIQGDARGRLAEGPWLLVGSGPAALVGVDPPLDPFAEEGDPPRRPPVDSALAASFRVYPVWPFAFAFDAGVVLVALGGALLVRGIAPARAIAAGLAAVPGVVLGNGLTQTLTFLVVVGSGLFGLVGVVGLAAISRGGRPRAWALGLVVLAATVIVTAWALGPYYPSVPEV